VCCRAHYCLRSGGASHASAPAKAPRAFSVSSCANDGDDDTAQIAIDPTDSSHIAVTYSIGTSAASVIALTSNAGHTWSRSTLPGTVKCDTGGEMYSKRFDPDLEFDPFGRLYDTESTETSGIDTGTSGIDTLVASAAPGGHAAPAGPSVSPRVGLVRDRAMADCSDANGSFVLAELVNDAVGSDP